MKKTQILVDTEKAVYLESFDIREVYLSKKGAIPIQVTKRRLYGGVQDGVDVVEINAGFLNFVVLLSRGMSIQKVNSRNVELKWDSPVGGPVHPKFVPLFAPNGCGWLEGFSEWLVRCGLESNGAPEFDSSGVLRYPLHGRLANLPAHFAAVSIDTETGVIILTGDVMETSVFGHKFLFKSTYTVKIGSTKLCIEDSVTNLLTSVDEFELLYHINTGMPLISPGARFVVPFYSMCPRDFSAMIELEQWDKFVEPETGRAETCYFFDLATNKQRNTKVALVGADGISGVSLAFNKEEFPYFILWKTQRPNDDIYVSGMEPAVNFPNTHSFEKKKGRIVSIAPKETKTFHLEIDVLSSEQEVEECVRDVECLQNGERRIVSSAPIQEWCE